MDYVDTTAAKIVLAVSDGDSIRRVAQKIDGTYSWVYTWVERLEEDDAIVEDTGNSVYYCVYPSDESITCDWVDGNPVIPLSETVEYMQEYRWNFQPALEMVAEDYGVDVDGDSPDYAPAQ